MTQFRLQHSQSSAVGADTDAFQAFEDDSQRSGPNHHIDQNPFETIVDFDFAGRDLDLLGRRQEKGL